MRRRAIKSKTVTHQDCRRILDESTKKNFRGKHHEKYRSYFKPIENARKFDLRHFQIPEGSPKEPARLFQNDPYIQTLQRKPLHRRKLVMKREKLEKKMSRLMKKSTKKMKKTLIQIIMMRIYFIEDISNQQKGQKRQTRF